MAGGHTCARGGGRGPGEETAPRPSEEEGGRAQGPRRAGRGPAGSPAAFPSRTVSGGLGLVTGKGPGPSGPGPSGGHHRGGEGRCIDKGLSLALGSGGRGRDSKVGERRGPEAAWEARLGLEVLGPPGGCWGSSGGVPQEAGLGGWGQGSAAGWLCPLRIGSKGPCPRGSSMGGGPRLTQQCLGAGWESLILPGNDGGLRPCFGHLRRRRPQGPRWLCTPQAPRSGPEGAAKVLVLGWRAPRGGDTMARPLPQPSDLSSAGSGTCSDLEPAGLAPGP